MITREEYRDGMARLAAAVNVITTDGPGGPGGFTASAVCSVTDAPATLLVCINLSSWQNALLHANAVLCVNTLADNQIDIARAFSTRGLSIEERFAGGDWTTLATGSPVLGGAVAAFDCRIAERLEKGTHAVILCEVQAIRMQAGGHGLIYFDRNFQAAFSPEPALQF